MCEIQISLSSKSFPRSKLVLIYLFFFACHDRVKHSIYAVCLGVSRSRRNMILAGKKMLRNGREWIGLLDKAGYPGSGG